MAAAADHHRLHSYRYPYPYLISDYVSTAILDHMNDVDPKGVYMYVNRSVERDKSLKN